MKKIYEDPQMDVVIFETEEEVTVSGLDFIGVDFEDLI